MNYNVAFDILLIAMSTAPAYFLVRTLLHIYRYEELSLLRYEWIPILLAGVFFVLWVVESSYFDLIGDFSVRSSGIRDATLFASVSIFAVATARFAETWGGYVRGVQMKRKLVGQSENRGPHLEERTERPSR